MNRVILRPLGQDEDVFNFIMAGFDVYCNKVSTSREELVKFFYSITKRTDIIFGELVWISTWLQPYAAHCHTPAGGQV